MGEGVKVVMEIIRKEGVAVAICFALIFEAHIFVAKGVDLITGVNNSLSIIGERQARVLSELADLKRWCSGDAR